MDEGFGAVSLPNALDSKYPSGSKELKWQWLFPQKNRWKIELTGQEERWHADESLMQRAEKKTFSKPESTIYTHVLNPGAGGVISPLDRM